MNIEALEVNYQELTLYQTWILEKAICLVRKLPLNGLHTQEQADEFHKWLGIIRNNLTGQYYGSDQIEHEIIGGGYTFDGQIDVNVKSFLIWAYKNHAIIPEELRKMAIKFKEESKTSDQVLVDNTLPEENSKFKKLRPTQSHRERCRGIASLLWKQDSTITIADMVLRDEIIIHGCENEKIYHEEVIRDWIKDLCPNRSPGRRSEKSKNK